MTYTNLTHYTKVSNGRYLETDKYFFMWNKKRKSSTLYPTDGIKKIEIERIKPIDTTHFQ
jgi:hypothetical protein